MVHFTNVAVSVMLTVGRPVHAVPITKQCVQQLLATATLALVVALSMPLAAVGVILTAILILRAVVLISKQTVLDLNQAALTTVVALLQLVVSATPRV